ncbi:MAG: hypothetical protein D6730_13655 [Bacteroidetes bacterium]|nr:MAG: hypothetical protein D6730_13655 [Bacteroidota bacterium]
MSKLLLIRHGQASFMSDDYDQLSPLGIQQSRVLGEWMAAEGLRFDRVYMGPMKRHLQTHDEAAAVYEQRQLPWPTPESIAEFEEHHGPQVTGYMLPRLIEQQAAFRQYAQKLNGLPPHRKHLLLYRRITQLWARGELKEADERFESWQAFRQRVEQGMRKVLQANQGGKTVAIFTSGGPVAAAVGFALGLRHEQVMELSWAVQNTATSEFLFSGDQISLQNFNVLTHLPKAEMKTFV